MPTPKAVHHLTIRVRDLTQTSEFFERVFGWQVDASLPDRRRIQIGDTRLVFKSPLPGTPDDDQFNEFRIGIDHISLRLDDSGAIAAVESQLRAAGVTSSGIQRDPTTGASVVVFRDPDNIQWEFYVE